MMREGWGRIVNVTTSLGTMLNAGSPTYGPSKAALEALSAIMAKDLDGTGVTVNVLVPGGITNTPMVSDEAGFERAKMIQPEVMAPPFVWLVSDAAGKVTGRRSLSIGIPRRRRNKRPRKLARRSLGLALRRCLLRRAALSPLSTLECGVRRISVRSSTQPRPWRDAVLRPVLSGSASTAHRGRRVLLLTHLRGGSNPPTDRALAAFCRQAPAAEW